MTAMEIETIRRYIRDAHQAYEVTVARLGIADVNSDLYTLLKAARKQEIHRRGMVTDQDRGNWEGFEGDLVSQLSQLRKLMPRRLLINQIPFPGQEFDSAGQTDDTMVGRCELFEEGRPVAPG